MHTTVHGRSDPWANLPTARLHVLGVDEIRTRARVAAETAIENIPDRSRERLVRAIEEDPTDAFSEYLLALSDPTYFRAFKRVFADPENGHREFDAEELAAWRRIKERAHLAEGADGTGGIAIPLVVDPMINYTGSGAVNSFRDACQVYTGVTPVYNGINSGGMTAAIVPRVRSSGMPRRR